VRELDCLVSLRLGTQGYGFRYADRIAITPAHASLRPEDRRRGNPVVQDLLVDVAEVLAEIHGDPMQLMDGEPLPP